MTAKENPFVLSKWKAYALAWWFNIAIASAALMILTVAPVANPEWPYLLAFFWAFYLFFAALEVKDYFSMRKVYLTLRYEQTPEYVKRWMA